MFLMFHLERPDVLPVGDLGIRRAIERAYGLDGLPDASAMEEIADAVAPAPHAGLPLPVALACRTSRRRRRSRRPIGRPRPLSPLSPRSAHSTHAPHRDRAIGLGDDLPAGHAAVRAEVACDDRRRSRQAATPGQAGARVVEDDVAAQRDEGMP